MTKAVVLAAGRGTRMRAAGEAVPLEPEQERWAARGVKPLIPFGGRPFLDYVLTSLADAGYTGVCLVVASGADPIRERYERFAPRRIGLCFAQQDSPVGTAHAVLAAQPFAGGDDFLLVNADNDYPVPALASLRGLDGAGLVGFRAEGLLRGNVSADRLSQYAIVLVNETGELTDIVEKPAPEQVAAAGRDALISMTCWRFRPAIFDACREVPVSSRGEHELPDAVRALVRGGERFGVVTSDDPVLDLGRREDVPGVAPLLRDRRVNL